MDQASLAKWWDEAWNEGLWTAPWSKALGGLTGAQAAWKPSPERHSIWQIVQHMIFWRQDALARLQGKPAPGESEVKASNFPQPAAPTDDAWRAAVKRFEESQTSVAAVLKQPGTNIERLQYLLVHDCYHFGQIMYLRALQGLPALD